MKNQAVYHVKRLERPMKIDGEWHKKEWQDISSLSIVNYMGRIPGFQPSVQARMMYDYDNLYVIFRVDDRYVRCVTNEINGPVWEDSCVEFFFAPDVIHPERYFNLEVNCGGTPLMQFNIIPRKNTRLLEPDDIGMIDIAHSMTQLIDPEITDPVKWTVEYRIPLLLPEKYSPVKRPVKGTEWRANFFKIAENNSNPHYITWSPVDNPVPDFHLPQFFGLLKFM